MSPILVTGMLVGLLQGIGRDVQVVRICKRSREQVNWHKAKLPWRRSAAWLLLRVGLRLVLDRAAVNSDGATRSSLYKPFIAYFLSSVLRKACQHAVLPSDVLYAMSAKIVRRIHKLNPADSTPWLSEVIESIGKNNCLLSDKWEHVQLEGRQRSGLDFQHLASLQFTEDADLSLPNLNRFFDWVKVRKSIIEDDMGSGDSTWFLRATHGKLPDMISYDTEMVAFQLIDMEAWTASHLEHWVTEKKSASSAVQDSMRQLKALIQHYYERAISEYGGNPESLSIMYLTTLELWVALDELACTAAPLLLKYHPGFPLDLLHVLVLSKTEHMSRLTRVEKYLSRRKSGGCQLPFEGFGSKNSFAVRYFDQSRDHQDLMNQIVTHSKAKRQEKLEELEREQMRYADLTQKIKNTAHDEEVNDVTGKVYCKWSCNCCSLVQTRDQMSISVFEWPLPRIESEAKAAVFEIRVPESVAIWREVTLMLLADVFESEASGGSSKERLYFVSDFNGLRRFRSRSTRVEPASMVKPFTASHYSNLPVATATKGTICVQHGCKYHYFDRTLSRPILDSVKRPKIPKSCSFAMAVKPPLREWVESTVRTSNEVIAGQSKCPSEMRLNAFRAFGHLRAGVRIQWVNILCQLMAPSLDFDSEAACLLILQAIGEAGPPDGSIFRMAHSVTQFEHFVIAMADAMASALDRIEESWGHSVALACLVFLGTRLLSLAPTQSARDQLLALLSRLRKVSYTWIKRLVEKLGHCATGIEHVEWTPRILFASLICIATFGVGVDTLTDILKSAEEGELLLEVAVLAREHLPASGRPSGSLELVLFQRWRGIAYLSQAILGRQITSMRNSCLDRAVKQVWPDSPTSNTWMAGTDAQSHVLSTSVTSRNGRHPLHVAYNLLTGILLVNGLPLRKLPTKFRETEAYRLLFGTQNLSVMPSAAPEMQFCSATLHQGFKAHFAMIERKLVVHAVRDGRTLEFIPPDCLKGDFPTSFISDFSHWLDLSTMEVEFRPILTPWVSSQSNWTLRLTNERYNLTRDGRFLIDLHSATAAALSVLLLSIETATNLHLILEPDLQKLEIDLPRVGITFSIRQGESAISSKQYGGMCIDENQQFSTLIGLRSALVLRPEDDGVESSAFRKVLIPQGTVSSRKAGEHMEVAISISSDHLHHAYVVDDKLGRLVDNGTLRSKLQLSYLHALTSHCLPDPLTGRTGTEEALRILKSSAVLSFQKLDDHCATLLVMIAGISPVRQYYPSHLKCMEQTEWSASLPSLSQHEDFYEVVQAIRSHAAECELFFEDTSPTRATQGINQSDSSLIRRARIRNSTFRVSEFGAEAHSTTYDKEYLSRTDLEGIKKVYRSTVFLDNGSQTLLTSPPDSLKKSIQDVIGSVIEGPSSATGKPALKLRFHFGWLAEPAESFSGLWCRMNESLASMEHSRDKYRLMFFFAALIFAKNSSWDIVQLLLARAIIPSVRSVQLPAEPKFNRTYGLTLSENTLKILAQNEACAFEDCPEFSLPARQRESRSETVLRRRSAWQSASDARVRELTQELINQWPCKSVYIPGNAAYKTYIKTDKLQAKVQRQFLEIWRNQQLSTALDDLVSEMNRLPVTQIGLPPQGERLTWSEMLGELSTPSELGFVAVSSLFSRPAPKTTRPSATDFAEHYEWLQKTFGSSRLSNLLDELSTLASMNDPDQAHVKQYIEDLRQSFTAYQSSERQAGAIVRLREDTTSRRVTLLRYQKICRERALEIREAIEDCLQANSVAQKAAYQGGLWPRVSPVFLLQRLARHHWKELPEGWRHCITNYAIALTYLQQAERLLNSSSRPTDLIRELMSSAHTWDPLQYPESLLLEVEQGLLIRKVQDDVASEMRNPRGDHSSVMQLNMGEGKSSVIVPIIAAALADGTRLVRIIVGKPQSKQMAHILISRLGGLLDRRVFFLPFSRSVCLRFGQGEQIQRMMRSCRAEGGVLLVQPEQLLSFQLMGLEYRHSSEPHIASTGKTILDIHDECGRVARDIVDESDENFSVKFELVYTMGLQQPVDYSPDRWTIIQDVLQLVRAIAKTMSVDHGVGLQFDENESGGFPTIRVLDASAGKRLLDSVASRICSLGLRGFPVQHQPARVRRAVLAYISNSDINRDGMEFMDNDQTGFSSDSTIKSLLLLRGLFAKGILEFALRQKRFRVNYGLAPERRPRTMLAVPYRAKDSPAPRSEFSHPDVVIVLTCLSYYYAGLSDDELFVCFDYLSKSDHASREYDSWAHQAPKLGHSLHHYWAINVQDRSQCIGRVFPALRYIKPVIDFYLSRVVFPKEMKEFPQKLSASGWDLARRKTHPLTGFSGTNDSRYMLPLPIRSLDLPEQQHTNAAVLDCLLGDENCVLEIKADGSAECQLTAAALLAAVSDCKPEVQVILDVGAQIVELNNRQMAEAWLRMVPAHRVDAVIFFDDRDNLLVLTRNGLVDMFLASPFSNQTDRCLVFLDQAHTRGTDLRLPSHFRAAVTLGPSVTKDALVQGEIPNVASLFLLLFVVVVAG